MQLHMLIWNDKQSSVYGKRNAINLERESTIGEINFKIRISYDKYNLLLFVK